jgi:hypothetical protein
MQRGAKEGLSAADVCPPWHVTGDRVARLPLEALTPLHPFHPSHPLHPFPPLHPLHSLRACPWKLSTGPTLTPPLARTCPLLRSSLLILCTCLLNGVITPISSAVTRLRRQRSSCSTYSTTTAASSALNHEGEEASRCYVAVTLPSHEDEEASRCYVAVTLPLHEGEEA